VEIPESDSTDLPQVMVLKGRQEPASATKKPRSGINKLLGGPNNRGKKRWKKKEDADRGVDGSIRKEKKRIET